MISSTQLPEALWTDRHCSPSRIKGAVSLSDLSHSVVAPCFQPKSDRRMHRTKPAFRWATTRCSIEERRVGYPGGN